MEVKPDASYSYRMEATIEAMPALALWAETAARNHADLNPKAVNSLLVCLEELVVNVALHATRDGFIPIVNIDLQITGGQIAVLIMDDGPPFDSIREAPSQVETDLDLMGIGGLGLQIVRKLTHSMSYERTGDWNCTRLEIE